MVRYPMQRIGVTAGFGLYNPYGTGATMHYAVDISRTQPKSFDVFAAHDGTVLASLFDKAGGNLIALRGSYNEKLDVITRYGHLRSRAVKAGDSVHCGDVIGVQGNTGTATTAQHLHFETWLVPKNYSYRAADRPDYAVDPLAICQLSEGQQFVCDACTRGFAAIPSPEPKITLTALAQATLHVTGEPPMYFYPSTAYAPYAGGYARCRDSVRDFVKATEFSARYSCENEELLWAYVDTDFGWVWVLVRAGESELTVSDKREDACGDTAEKQALQQKLDAYAAAVQSIRSALAAL